MSSARIKNILNFWAIKNWIQRKNLEGSKNQVAVTLQENRDAFLERMEKRFEIARFIVEHLFEVSKQDKNSNPDKAEVLVEFSVNGLKDAYLKSNWLFQREVDVETVEDALFYLSRIESIKIEGGFLVTYNQLTNERNEVNSSKSYTKDDSAKLNQLYIVKLQHIPLVGDYDKTMGVV